MASIVRPPQNIGLILLQWNHISHIRIGDCNELLLAYRRMALPILLKYSLSRFLQHPRVKGDQEIADFH